MISNCLLDSKGCTKTSNTGAPSIFLNTKGCTKTSPTKPPQDFVVSESQDDNIFDRLNSYLRT